MPKTRKAAPAPKRFEVYLVRLDPVLGAEIGKTRPGVVISPDEANDALRTVIVAPLTSVRRAWPTRVPVKIARIAGDAALDQMRAVDKARLVKRVGALSAAKARAALGRLGELFGGEGRRCGPHRPPPHASGVMDCRLA